MKMRYPNVVNGGLAIIALLSGCASQQPPTETSSTFSTTAERTGTIRVPTPRGRELRLRLDEQTWRPIGEPVHHTDRRVTRTVRVEPVNAGRAATATWHVDRPRRLTVSARLSARGAEAVKAGEGDGTIVYVKRSGVELGRLTVDSTTARSLTIDVTEPADVTLSVSAGVGGDVRNDATYLTLTEEDR